MKLIIFHFSSPSLCFPLFSLHRPIPEHILNTLNLYPLLNVTEQVLRPYNNNNNNNNNKITL